MREPLVLASASPIRATLLRNAGLDFAAEPARIDEDAVRQSLVAEGAGPRDIADALAGMKAARVSARRPGALVIGSDQVLVYAGELFAKPDTVEAARAQLMVLRGRSHELLSAVVVCREGRPLWRHVGEARLRMRDFSDDWLDGYLVRNGEAALGSVGAYRIEEEGVRLFSAIDGDYFTILGLPLLPLLSWLSLRGTIAS
jgi:septum formation protein